MVVYFQTIDEDVQKIIEHWFYMLNPKPIQFIMNVTKQPFRDLRFSALNILLQLVRHNWAQKLMSQEPGTKFLLL